MIWFALSASRIRYDFLEFQGNVSEYIGMSIDEKRLNLNKETYAFTNFWLKYLPKGVMPRTRFADYNRNDQVRLFLPGFARKLNKNYIAVYNIGEKASQTNVLLASGMGNSSFLTDGNSVGQEFVVGRDISDISEIELYSTDRNWDKEKTYLRLWDHQNKEKMLGTAVLSAVKESGSPFYSLLFKFIVPANCDTSAFGPSLVGPPRGKIPYYFELFAPKNKSVIYSGTALPIEAVLKHGKASGTRLSFTVRGKVFDREGYSVLATYKKNYFVLKKIKDEEVGYSL